MPTVNCTHRLNFEVDEEYVVSTYYRFEDGEHDYTESQSNVGRYTGMFVFKCNDCGYTKRYGKNIPKWLSNYLNSVNGANHH